MGTVEIPSLPVLMYPDAEKEEKVWSGRLNQKIIKDAQLFSFLFFFFWVNKKKKKSSLSRRLLRPPD